MSEAVDILLGLCRCLRVPGCLDDDTNMGGLPERAEQWKSVIELANAHYLTPALWRAIQDKGLVDLLPLDASAFLKEAHRLNVARNTRIRVQALEFLEALGDADIKAVVLKGGVHLFEGYGRAFETRMMMDLDLLVPQDCLKESFKIAKELGYQVLVESVHPIHHLDPIGRQGDLASIEIHRDVGLQKHVLPAQDVLRDAVALNSAELKIHIPNPTHRAVHNIFHSEIETHNNYAIGRISIRYLHDLSLLRTQHDTHIDWNSVRDHLSRQRYDYLLAGYLYLANRLLGTPMPEAIAISPSARRHYRWCLAQLKWPALKVCVSFIWAAGHVFRRPWIEYLYGEARSPFALQYARFRFFMYLANRHKSRSFDRVLRIYESLVRVP